VLYLVLYTYSNKGGLKNAFSAKLGSLGFNFYQMLLVDLLHEFVLGVWKALFIHLLRMLVSYNKALVNELDRRYVSMLLQTFKN
jgi:hypothetical protein